jgi:hypothetical protein
MANERSSLGPAKSAVGDACGTSFWRLLSADADAAKVAHRKNAKDVHEAVSTAKKHILILFEDKKLLKLGLEEAFFVERQDVWHTTLGFSHSWESLHVLVAILNPIVLKREYKIV